MWHSGAYPLLFGTSNTERLRIDSGGNVGIGTSSPGIYGVSTRSLTVSSTSGYAFLQVQGASATGGAIDFGTDTIRHAEIASLSGSGLAFYTNSTNSGNGLTERMRIDSSGNVGIGTAGALAGWRVHSKSAMSDSTGGPLLLRNSADENLFFVRGDGLVNTGLAAASPYNSTTANAANVHVDSAGNLFRSTSSLRYKTNIEDYVGGLEKVGHLRPVTFNSLKDPGGKRYAGLIAEEVHDAGLTEFVEYNKEGEPDAVHYANLTALLIGAVKEQSSLIVQLQQRLATLESA
jgi:hypothetical protein